MNFKNIDDVYQVFVDELGVPDNQSKLLEYLTFLLNYSISDDALYFENHHILPRSPFKKFINVPNNIIKLAYCDHVFAHEMLAEAYTTRRFLRTLNFMKSNLSKNHNILSVASKKGWNNLKNNQEAYESWREARCKYAQNLSSSEQSRRSRMSWEKSKSDPKRYAERCQKIKDGWTSELKEKKSLQMTQYFKLNPEISSSRGLKRWANVSLTERIEFSKKVKIALSNPDVKKKISSKLKNKWKDPEFKNKMANRQPTYYKYELISPYGEIFNRTGAFKIIKEFNFSASVFRKFTNTGMPADSVYLANAQVRNTIGWIINKIN